MTPPKPSSNALLRTVAPILLGVVVLYAGLQYVAHRLSITPSFVALERAEAEEDLERCVSALNREIQHLDMFVHDWSGWDDTYAFAQDRNEQYVAANLVPSTFLDNVLNVICMADPRGDVIWGQAVDLDTEEDIPLEDLVTLPLAAPDTTEDEDAACAGVALTRRGPMLIAVRQILTSQDQGPPRGLLAMGRLLTQDVLDGLVEQTGVEFSITPVQGGSPTGAEAALLQRLAAPDAPVIEQVAEDALIVTTRIDGIDGRPALILRATTPRDITHKGAQAARFAFVSTLGAGLVMLLFMVVLLWRAVIVPLRALTGHIVAITKSGDLSSRLNIHRNDEIGTVAREFDRLLGRIEYDIDRRETAEAALRESEAHIRAIVNAAADGILSVDDAAAIESANPAAERMFGYAEGELSGKHLQDLIPQYLSGYVPSGAPGLLALAVEKPGGFRAELTGKRKDGSTFPAYATISDMLLGSRRLFSVLVSDLTEYKRLHEQMMRAQHLATIGEMGAQIAHEIRNPLTGISSAIQVLDKQAHADDTVKEVFRHVLDEVARVDKTVQDLLQFARPWTPEKHPCNVHHALSGVRDQASTQKEFAGIRFVLDVPPDAAVLADDALFKQVAWNLFRNAAQAMPEGGEIRVSVEAAPDTFRLLIADTGTGIEPAALEQVFKPFFTTRTRGTGLGLAVCRQIVEAHGGSIRVSSSPGSGTTVVIELPLEE